MQLGFSYVGLIFLAMLLIPNLLWTKNQPKDYEKYVTQENKVLRGFERVGEAAVTCVALIFRDFNIHPWTLWSLWLVAASLGMILYEIYWFRYFKSKKTMADFYSSLLGVPVAGAVLPVCAFFFLGVCGKNIWMLISVLVLGIGHIGIHWNHKREIKS